MLSIIAFLSTIVAEIIGGLGILLGLASLAVLVLGGAVAWLGTWCLGFGITISSFGTNIPLFFVIEGAIASSGIGAPLVAIFDIIAVGWLFLGELIPIAGLLITSLSVGLGGGVMLFCGIGGLCLTAVFCALDGFCCGFACSTLGFFICPCLTPFSALSVLGVLSCNCPAVVCAPMFGFSWCCIAPLCSAIPIEIAIGTLFLPFCIVGCPISPLVFFCGLPTKLCALGTGTMATMFSMGASCTLYTSVAGFGLLGFLGFVLCSALGITVNGTAIGLFFLSIGSCIGILSTCTATVIAIPCCVCMSAGVGGVGTGALCCGVPSAILGFMGITALGTTLTLGGAFTMYFTEYCSPYIQPYIDYCLPSCVACYGTGFEVLSYPVSCFGSLCGPVAGCMGLVPGALTTIPLIGACLAGL